MKPKGKRIAEKTWLDDQEKGQRLAVLLIREIDRIVFDLDFRRELLFQLWSRDRVRQPLLRAVSSRFYDIEAELLILFPPDVIQKLDDFYRALDEFIFYMSYTEDMPQNMAQKFDAYLDEIKTMAPALVEQLAALVPDYEVELAAFEPPTPDLTTVTAEE